MKIKMEKKDSLWMVAMFIIIGFSIITMFLLTLKNMDLQKDKPECYLTIEDVCMHDYDFESMFYKNPRIKQCCLKPHYMLQGIDSEMLNYCDDYQDEIVEGNVTNLFKY